MLGPHGCPLALTATSSRNPWVACPGVPSRTVSLAAHIFLCRYLIDNLAPIHTQLSPLETSLVPSSLAPATMFTVAAFSFGAFGDFVALLDLAQEVSKSLNASSGGSEDYLMLLVEVDSLVHILQSAITPSTSIRLSQLSPALVQTAFNALKSLQDVLDILKTKVVTYQDKLRKGGSARMMMESWGKIGWGLLVKDGEVKKLRWELSYHIKTLQIVMSYAQW